MSRMDMNYYKQAKKSLLTSLIFHTLIFSGPIFWLIISIVEEIKEKQLPSAILTIFCLPYITYRWIKGIELLKEIKEIIKK